MTYDELMRTTPEKNKCASCLRSTQSSCGLYCTSIYSDAMRILMTDDNIMVVTECLHYAPRKFILK